MHHGFRQINLVSDLPHRAQLIDPNLVNPWGLAFGPTTPLWVANNGTGTATLYSGAHGGMPFSQVPVVFTVPQGAPTGQVFNGATASSSGTAACGAGPVHLRLRGGRHLGMDADRPAADNVRAKLTVPGAVFKGLAIGFFHKHPALYAADFAHNKVVGGRLPLPR